MPHNFDNRYTVIVGNVGTIYDGTNRTIAHERYRTYVKLSREGYGRVAGEPVTLMHGDEIVKEYNGTLTKEHTDGID